MRTTALIATILTGLLGATVYSLINLSPVEHITLYYWLPICVGLLIATLTTSVRCWWNWRRQISAIPIIRQGLLAGIVAGVLLYLQGLRVVDTVDTVLLVLAAVLLELFFQAEKTDLRSVKPQ